MKRLLTSPCVDAAEPESVSGPVPGALEWPLLTWSADLAVGDERIDSDHKHLVDLINRVHEAIARGFETRVVETVLIDLAAFTRYHFQREERIMAAHRFEETPAHQEEHAALVDDLDAMIAAYRADPTSLDGAALARIRTWFLDHLDGADGRFAAFLAQQHQRDAG